ncbi:MAG: sugar transferase [Terriglobales bacterium]
MGELANTSWRQEPLDGPSPYARMIPGVSGTLPVRKPVAAAGRAATMVRRRSSAEARTRTLLELALPHPATGPLPLYWEVVADLMVLAVACGAQKLLVPNLSLSALELPLFAVLVTLFAFSEGVYREGRWPDASEPTSLGGLAALGRSVLFALTLVYFAGQQEIGAPALVATFAMSFSTLMLYRQMRQFARMHQELEARNVLIVGGGAVGRSIARTLATDPIHRAFVRGSVDDELPLSSTVLGRIADLDWLARSEFIDEVIVALPGRPEQAREAAEAAFRNHLDIRAVPDLPPGHWPQAGVDFIGEVPVVTLHREPVPSAGLYLKRLLDVMSAGMALLLASPVMAAVALLIRLDSHGPVIYGAERTGAKGRRFRCYKFRSMVSNADGLKANLQARNQREGPIFKIADDPRITRVGWFIRRYSLDELPQLWNVLLGDMSMVGPRPHPVDEVNHYELHHYRRLDMKPGITGLWQITARHSPSFELNMHLDLTYIENWSLRLDLRILLGTVRVLFRPEGN